MKIKNELELINDATQLIVEHNFEKAYKTLHLAEVYTDYGVSSLLLILRLSIILNKLNNIPGHIIILKSKRDDGYFTPEQETEFFRLIKEYQQIM